MSEGVLRYQVPMKIGGEIRTVTIEKHGPVVFLVSTTRNALNAENETRLISLELDDSAKQTAKVLAKVSEREGLNLGAPQIEFKPWHDFQRCLAAGERRVIIPFAKDLDKLIPPNALRLRRDYGQVLRAIKAHAVIHRQHRKRRLSGEVIATIRDDYAKVRDLMSELLDETAEVRMKRTMPETIEAVEEAVRHRSARQPRDEDCGALVSEIAKVLELDTSSTRRRLYAALNAGVIENLEERKGRPAQYRVSRAGRPRHRREDHQPTLPSVEKLREA
jgi:hypothetical protein